MELSHVNIVMPSCFYKTNKPTNLHHSHQNSHTPSDATVHKCHIAHCFHLNPQTDQVLSKVFYIKGSKLNFQYLIKP